MQYDNSDWHEDVLMGEHLEGPMLKIRDENEFWVPVQEGVKSHIERKQTEENLY